jgi:hypothetical protein
MAHVARLRGLGQLQRQPTKSVSSHRLTSPPYEIKRVDEIHGRMLDCFGPAEGHVRL